MLPTDWALLIGVETYLDRNNLPPAAHAEADVAAIRESLKTIGFSDNHVITLIGEDATKTSVEHHVRQLVEDRLSPSATFFLFFAGHSLASESTTHLLCRDTRKDDPGRTAIDLGGLIASLQSSACVRHRLFLGCPVADLNIESGSGIDDASVLVFAASRPPHEALASDKLKRGVWAYHLALALGGDVPEILTPAGVLTADALDDYLRAQVPLTLRDTFSARKLQAPWSAGIDDPDLVIADLGPAIARRKTTRTPPPNAFKDLIFVSHQRAPIKLLSGFVKGRHSVSKIPRDKARSVVADLARDELKSDIDSLQELIRKEMGYRRKEIEVCPVEDGYASIRTPDFQYTISVGPGDDSSEARFTRELSDIRHPDVLGDPRFGRVFDGRFDAIRLTLDRTIDVEDLIDRVEAEGLRPDYKTDASEFTLPIGTDATVRVTADRMELSYLRKQGLAPSSKGSPAPSRSCRSSSAIAPCPHPPRPATDPSIWRTAHRNALLGENDRTDRSWGTILLIGRLVIEAENQPGVPRKVRPHDPDPPSHSVFSPTATAPSEPNDPGIVPGRSFGVGISRTSERAERTQRPGRQGIMARRPSKPNRLRSPGAERTQSRPTPCLDPEPKRTQFGPRAQSADRTQRLSRNLPSKANQTQSASQMRERNEPNHPREPMIPSEPIGPKSLKEINLNQGFRKRKVVCRLGDKVLGGQVLPTVGALVLAVKGDRPVETEALEGFEDVRPGNQTVLQRHKLTLPGRFRRTRGPNPTEVLDRQHLDAWTKEFQILTSSPISSLDGGVTGIEVSRDVFWVSVADQCQDRQGLAVHITRPAMVMEAQGKVGRLGQAFERIEFGPCPIDRGGEPPLRGVPVTELRPTDAQSRGSLKDSPGMGIGRPGDRGGDHRHGQALAAGSP